MKSPFLEVSVESLVLNPFTKIGKEWMLVTAGSIEKWNTMTFLGRSGGNMAQKCIVRVCAPFQIYT